ncbi:MAG TPA: hypothetical protein VGG64_11830 [Pirellulales bacterium]|jgi:hypothetical protein
MRIVIDTQGTSLKDRLNNPEKRVIIQEKQKPSSVATQADCDKVLPPHDQQISRRIASYSLFRDRSRNMPTG